ncbi:MAG: hypothetical protein K2Q22_12770, partial [Cytophagales bacterium]|nr:hypothetical protein [Cytophagales bacterium]
MAANKYGIEYFTFESLFHKTVDTIIELNLKPNSKVLDVPAGPGALTQILKEDFGFETSAAEFITSNWKYDKIPVSFADLSVSLPYQDNEFDL